MPVPGSVEGITSTAQSSRYAKPGKLDGRFTVRTAFLAHYGRPLFGTAFSLELHGPIDRREVAAGGIRRGQDAVEFLLRLGSRRLLD